MSNRSRTGMSPEMFLSTWKISSSQKRDCDIAAATINEESKIPHPSAVSLLKIDTIEQQRGDER